MKISLLFAIFIATILSEHYYLSSGAVVYKKPSAQASNFVVSGSFDNTIKVWDTTQKSLRLSTCVDGPSTNNLMYDANTLISCVADSRVVVINLITGNVVQTLNETCMHLLRLNNGYMLPAPYERKLTVFKRNQFTGLFSQVFNFTPALDGSTTLIMLRNRPYFLQTTWFGISLYHQSNATLLTKYSLYGVLNAIELDNGNIATGDWSYNVRIWKVSETGITLLMTLTGHTGPVTRVIALNNNLIASASSFSDSIYCCGYSGGDKRVLIWNSLTGALVKTLEGHTDYVNSILLMDNNRLASSDWDMNIKLWNLVNYSLIKTIKFDVNYNKKKKIFLSNLNNGKLLVASNEFAKMKIYYPSTGTLESVLNYHTSNVTSLNYYNFLNLNADNS